MKKSRIVIAGASGVVGRHLVAAALARYDVTVLTRTISGNEPNGSHAVVWNPKAAKEQNAQDLKTIAEALENARAVINLAGSSIASGRFDATHKASILNSRLESTATLLQAFKQTQMKPPVWFQASAVGYYGNRAEEILDETSTAQEGYFLSEVSQAWEDAAKPVQEDARLVIGRLGLVLAKDAEAWRKLLTPIKFFVGGPLGSGKQWYPWIDADDLANAILYLIANSSSQGVYNLSAPNPARQLDIAKAAANKLGRPAFVPAPAFALRLLLGDLADALLLPSAHVLPKRLQEEAFFFEQATLDQEIDKLL